MFEMGRSLATWRGKSFVRDRPKFLAPRNLEALMGFHLGGGGDGLL